MQDGELFTFFEQFGIPTDMFLRGVEREGGLVYLCSSPELASTKRKLLEGLLHT